MLAEEDGDVYIYRCRIVARRYDPPYERGPRVNLRTSVRLLLSLIASAAAGGAVAVPANASLSVSSFSVAPSTTQAGGTAAQPGPDLTIDAQFSSSNADTPKDLTLSLAPGLLANPSIVPLCSTQAFQAGVSPDASRIGHGLLTGTAPEFGLTLSLPTDAYLIRPQGSEVARIGLPTTSTASQRSSTACT